MGYYLMIDTDKAKMEYLGQKLVGYVDDDKLTSIQYLKEIGKYENEVKHSDIYLDWPDDSRRTRITASEFRKWCELYTDDLQKNYREQPFDRGWFLEDKDIKELMESDEDKILHWG